VPFFYPPRDRLGTNLAVSYELPQFTAIMFGLHVLQVGWRNVRDGACEAVEVLWSP